MNIDNARNLKAHRLKITARQSKVQLEKPRKLGEILGELIFFSLFMVCPLLFLVWISPFIQEEGYSKPRVEESDIVRY